MRIVKQLNSIAIRQKPWFSLVIAVLIVLAAAALREIIFNELGRGIPYLTFYPAVLIAAIIGGLYAGLIATTLSAISAYLWVQQGWMSSIEWLAMAFFIGICVLITFFARAMLRSNAKALQVDTIKESEERLRLIFENANEAIVVTQDELIKYCNPQITKISRYTTAEIHGMNFSQLIHPGDLGKVMQEYRARLSGEQPKNRYSVRIMTKDGQEKVVNISSSFVNWEGRAASLAMITEISMLKKIEKELQISEERYKLVVEGSDAGIWDYNISTGEIYYSDRFKELMGYEPLEMNDDTPEQSWNHLHPDFREIAPLKLNQHLKKEIPFYHIDYLVQMKSGEYRWFQGRGKAVWDEDGNPTRVAGSFIDIHDRKIAEEKIIRSEELFRELMEQSPMAMAILLPDGKITQVNRMWKKLSKLNDEEASKFIATYNIFNDPQLDQLGVMDQVKDAFKGNSAILPPFQYKAGQAIEYTELQSVENFESPWIQCHLNSINDAKGNIVYIVNTYVNINDLKIAEENSKKQRDVLARINRATSMGQLTGSIAHELNQPLTGILSNAQAAELILKRKNLDLEEIKEIFTEIINDTKRAGDVIRNLRALYSEKEVELLPVEINSIVKEVVVLMQAELINQKINLTKEYGTDIPMVMGNKIQIQQVLVNLIMNGIHALTDQGLNTRNIWITTSYKKNEVKVCVNDNGLGIDDEIIDTIFEPLFTRKKSGSGMGMGLAISNSIIKAHGGRLTAENRPEGGAQVCFVLPGLLKALV